MYEMAIEEQIKRIREWEDNPNSSTNQLRRAYDRLYEKEASLLLTEIKLRIWLLHNDYVDCPNEQAITDFRFEFEEFWFERISSGKVSVSDLGSEYYLRHIPSSKQAKYRVESCEPDGYLSSVTALKSEDFKRYDELFKEQNLVISIDLAHPKSRVLKELKSLLTDAYKKTSVHDKLKTDWSPNKLKLMKHRRVFEQADALIFTKRFGRKETPIHAMLFSMAGTKHAECWGDNYEEFYDRFRKTYFRFAKSIFCRDGYFRIKSLLGLSA
ncbi:MAG: hypothetical protein HLUCCO02_05355 [Idiomarinaceae bacterium HL-53]|nr:MAG: hypothetical protein HLUCCO02_05355 [Idiomarinaceae bacterium HL-53]CUS47985.1 hypothetical protein Ga0003345_0924 [Idiomarinaceae bacterium HL-53]